MTQRFTGVGIDMDGVLANFAKGFTTVAHEMFPKAPILDDEDKVKDWDWSTWYPLSSYQLMLVWQKIFTEKEEFWMGLESIPGSIAPIRELMQDPSVVVYFVTARRQSAGTHLVKQCSLWLAKRGIPRPQVIVTPHKGAFVKSLKLDYFLDDKVANCNDVQEQNPDCKVYLMNRTHNKNMLVSNTITRVSTTEEFIINLFAHRYTLI